MVVMCGYETVKDALVNHAEEFSARPYVPVFFDMFKEHGIYVYTLYCVLLYDRINIQRILALMHWSCEHILV